MGKMKAFSWPPSWTGRGWGLNWVFPALGQLSRPGEGRVEMEGCLQPRLGLLPLDSPPPLE